MNKDFIAKLETKRYLIGSFDVYQELSKEIIKNNSKITDEEVDSIFKSMPATYRAAIVDKETSQYIGYIGLYKVDAENNSASMRFEVVDSINSECKEEILNEFKKYLDESLNIQEISEFVYTTKEKLEIEKTNVIFRSNIVIPNKLLVPGISEEIMNEFSQDYSIPKLQMPFTIKSSDRVIGIIGLSELLWPNKRANLNLYLDKNLGNDITKEISEFIIDDYINYVHNSNIHNVNLTTSGSNKEMIDLLEKTEMNYYGTIPYGSNTGENIESKIMFQHTSNMKKQNGIIIPDNKSILITQLGTEKTEMDECIELDNGYKLVSPKAFEKLNIDFNEVLKGHIKALQERQGFSIPLGEDKYILQKGNSNYGLYKLLINYNYVILNDKNNYAGYTNILRNNANGKNAEVEIGIDPSLQNKGLGTSVINRFYDELFSIGYASVTSAVFNFNTPSLKLHEKVAELNGIRLESYYINGKLWNMNFYSKTNDSVIEEPTKKIV